MNSRQARYHQKSNFIFQKINSLPASPKNSIEIDATLYRIQVAIEAAMDLSAMILKDKGHTISDDYNNLQELIVLNIISEKMGQDLKKLNGLRNAIVHKYNHFEEEVLLKNKANICTILIGFLKEIDHELKTTSRKNKKRT